MQTCLLIIIISAILTIPVLGSDLNGVVKSASGRPLANVFVYSRSLEQIGNSSFTPFAITDNKGYFRLEDHGKVLFLRCDGFIPKAILLQAKIANVEIVLEEIQNSSPIIRQCPSTTSQRIFIAGRLRFSIPDEAIIDEGQGSDHRYFSIKPNADANSEILSGLWGRMSTFGFPPEEWITGSKKFTLLAYQIGPNTWVEATGQSKDGTFWRFLGRGGEGLLSYHNASTETAAFFDQIIDSVCTLK